MPKAAAMALRSAASSSMRHPNNKAPALVRFFERRGGYVARVLAREGGSVNELFEFLDRIRITEASCHACIILLSAVDFAPDQMSILHLQLIVCYQHHFTDSSAFFFIGHDYCFHIPP